MARKKGFVGSSLSGLRDFQEALSALKRGRVDVGFFAGKDAREAETPAQAAARAKRVGRYTGAGSRPGFYKQGVEFAKRRAKLGKQRNEAILSNAAIAAKNEFGVGVPRRSMLRMPLHLHGDQVAKRAKTDAMIQLKTLAGNPKRAVKKVLDRVGVAAVFVVQEAFDTRGFGSWKPNAPETIALKGSDAPLIDTAQMRHAVDWRTVA